MVKTSEKLMFFQVFVFGSFLGGFWEAKILDFRTFCVTFSMLFSNNVLKARKIEKKQPTEDRRTIFGSDLRNARPAGERIREGSEASRDRRYRKRAGASRLHTFGGRRIIQTLRAFRRPHHVSKCLSGRVS